VVTLAVKRSELLAVGQQKDGIWRRSEDSYYVRMMVDGKRQYICAGSNYRAAVLLAQEAKQKRTQEKMTGRNTLVGDLFKKKSDLTLNQLIDRYLEVKRPGLKPATITFYDNLTPYLAELSEAVVEDLSLPAISSFITSLQKRKLSAKTINHTLTLVKSVCNLAVKEQWIEKNPFTKVSNLRVQAHEPKPFSKDELTKIFAKLDDHLLPYFLLQASTGIRTGELMAVRFSDFDWSHNQLRISRSRWKKKEDSTKTAGSVRTIFLTEEVKQLLKDLQKKRKAPNDTPLVVNRNGEPYQVYLHKYWKKALKDAKVPYRNCYTLRSSFASIALQQGVDLGYISKTLGHTSIKITADKYLRYIKDADKDNKDKVNQMMTDMSLTTKIKK
jgi:integrase